MAPVRLPPWAGPTLPSPCLAPLPTVFRRSSGRPSDRLTGLAGRLRPGSGPDRPDRIMQSVSVWPGGQPGQAGDRPGRRAGSQPPSRTLPPQSRVGIIYLRFSAARDRRDPIGRLRNTAPPPPGRGNPGRIWVSRTRFPRPTPYTRQSWQQCPFNSGLRCRLSGAKNGERGKSRGNE